MCIKIVRLKEESEYDSNKPLEEQLRGSKQVVIDYDPQDSSIDSFLSQIERLCKNGIQASLNIKFNHNNNLRGAKIAKEMRHLAKDLDLNEFIKKAVSLQSDADKKLEEMAEICLKR